MRIAWHGLLLGACIAVAGCGARSAPWTRDDADGVAIPVEVDLRPGFLDSPLVRAWREPAGPRWRFSVGVGVGIGHHHPYHRPYDPFYDPWWRSAPPPAVTLLIGDGPAQGQIMRWPLERGTQSASLRLRPGRVATVSVRGDGGLDGFEALGTFAAAEGVVLRIVLDADGGRLTAGPATAAGLGPATAAGAGPATAAAP